MPPSSSPKTFSFFLSSGTIFALLATLVWSGNFIVGRELSTTLSPIAISYYRWTAAFLCVLPLTISSLLREWRHFWQHKAYYLLISLIGVTIFNTVIYFASHKVPALNMSLIAISSPLFTLILGRMLFGDPLSLQRIGGVLVVLVGILYLLCKGEFALLFSLSFGKHDLLMLAASLCFSVYTLMFRKRPQGCSDLSFQAMTFALGLLMLTPAFIYTASTSHIPPPWSPDLIWYVLYLGAGPSLFSFWAWGKAIAKIGSARASIIYYTLPLFCGIEAVLWLHEPILPVHYISGVLIVSGLILATQAQTHPVQPKKYSTKK